VHVSTLARSIGEYARKFCRARQRRQKTVLTYEEAAQFVIDAAKGADDIQHPLTQAQKAQAKAAAGAHKSGAK
jgi:hypothetical protein